MSKYIQPNKRKINRLFRKVINDDTLVCEIFATLSGNYEYYRYEKHETKDMLNAEIKFIGETKFISLIEKIIKLNSVSNKMLKTQILNNENTFDIKYV